MNGAAQSYDDESATSDNNFEDEHYDESLRPGVFMLGLSTSYVPGWKPRDAFRELYQNWKDALISSFKLDPRSFTPVVEENPNHIGIRIHNVQPAAGTTTAPELLGYILFDKKKGSLELTNFKATLDMKHLSLGVSEKRDQNNLAGTHGEGFKLAALVLCRSGLAVKFTSTSFYWNFSLKGKDKTTLACRLSHIKDTKLHRDMKQYADKAGRSGFERGLTANSWQDVKVEISKPRNAHTPTISERQFKEWMNVTIELDPPATDKVVHTSYGDLILDPRFKGFIYLKGLQIDGHEIDYAHGYNFARGHINRDRDRLADLKEEKRALSRIWEEAILKKDNEIADICIALIQTQKTSAETLWTHDRVTQPAAELLWQRLKDSHPDAFFHLGDSDLLYAHKNDQLEIIRQDLEKVPFSLSRELWKMLRKAKLVRSPEKKQTHRFSTSSMIACDQDPVHISMIQALKACMSLDPALSSLKLCVVDGGGTQLELMFDPDARSIKIHQMWLDFKKVHEHTTCEIHDLVSRGRLDQSEHFCDHIIEDLFELILDKAGGSLEIPSQRQKVLRRKARSCLRSMPRSVKISQLQPYNTLEVTWNCNRTELGLDITSNDIQYLVILHRESTCKSARENLLHVAPTPANLFQHGTTSFGRDLPTRCGCAAQSISQAESKARFYRLSLNDKYFPMVARMGKDSFFGMPPASIALGGYSRMAPPSPRVACPPIPLHEPSSPIGRSDVRQTRYSPEPVITPSCNIDFSSSDDLNDVNDAHDSIRNHIAKTLANDLDQTEWQDWFQGDLLREFSRYSANSEHPNMQFAESVASIECQTLDFQFERDEYACVRLVNSGGEEFPIFVHDIGSQDGDFSLDTSYLLVTKYSALKRTLQTNKSSTSNETSTSTVSSEVMIHFRKYDKMGSREDAEMIRISDIVGAKPLMASTGTAITDIDYVIASSQDLTRSSMFCRFAISSAQRGSESCLTPIVSHLLPRQDRWKEPKFRPACEPVIYDCSTGVLGPAEGLYQAGFEIEAGIGFDPAKHHSWKARHPASQVYDGSVNSIMRDIENGQLYPPIKPESAVPKVAVIAGHNVPFRLNDKNTQLPVCEQFLEVLDRVEAISEGKLAPTFTVVLVSAAILHSKALPRFNATLLHLLERRLSVHMKICSARDFRLPLQNDILVMVASPMCSVAPWNLFWPAHDPTQRVSIKDLIANLSFKNSRTAEGKDSGFTCLTPNLDTSQIPRRIVIYNHETGHQESQPLTQLQWDTEKVSALSTVPKLWSHPTHHDRITVRELARLQGSPDDFIFYCSRDDQYQDIWNAFPPIISKTLGRMIQNMLQGSQAIKIGDRVQGSKGQKRARVDDEIE